MTKYKVWVKFVNGDSDSFDVQAAAYKDLVVQITENNNGWLQIEGKLIHLNNVTKVEISEAAETARFSL